MQKQFVLYIFIFFISACILSAIFPYPIFSKYTNITENEAIKISNFKETELENIFSIKPKILEIEFCEINYILPEKFELIDISTEEILITTRIGGKNHADISFDKRNLETLHNICVNWSWETRPVLIKLNETAYLPASITCYPHGYNNHFCLHFKDSKTDGTQKISEKHQQTIAEAIRLGKKIIYEF